jgi:hypothetical protein
MPPASTSPSHAEPGMMNVPVSHLSAPAKAGIVRIVICTCLAVTVLAAASIYWRWSSIVEPTSYIVVHGDESHTGTVIVVKSMDHPGAMATLSKDNEYSTSIFLHAGSYRIVATRQGEELVNTTLLLGHRQAGIIDLRRKKVEEARASGRYLPDARWMDDVATIVAYPSPAAR